MSTSEHKKHGTLLVRADANRQMGIGHAMRCLAVAEQFVADGYRVVFAMHRVPQALLGRLNASGVEVLIIERDHNNPQGCCEIAQEIGANLAILDGYHIGQEYEVALKETGMPCLRFDDYMPGTECAADIVVNASPHAKHEEYQGWAPKSRLLLGPAYIAFRSEMREAYEQRMANSKTEENAALSSSGSIMVNFGGSDHLDMTIRTVQAIAALLPDANIEAVTGAAYPNPERLSNLGLDRLTHHHNSNSLPEIMQRARMAISAGGLTVAELALFRIPTILAITAANQIKGAHVSWCHTIMPQDNEEEIDTDDMLAKILLETERLWNLPDERQLITDRIPNELDIFGARRIAEALIQVAR